MQLPPRNWTERFWGRIDAWSMRNHRGQPRLPNTLYSWRMPVKCAAWNLAWWLMCRVVLGWMTPEGQARVISMALGAYRPGDLPPGYLVGGSQTNTGGSNTTTYVEVRKDEA